MGRRARRREHDAQAGPRTAKSRRTPSQPRGRAAGVTPARRPSRSEIKDAEARAKLVPLREGERPRAVTVAAFVAAALALGNVIAYAAGTKIGHRKPAITGVLAYSSLMAIAAWGMWRARYWAVLGMQAILAILILLFGILMFAASNAVTVLIALAVIAPAGTLFWFLVKSLARIQMPDRRPR